MDDGSIIILDKRKPTDETLTALSILPGGKHRLLSGSAKGEKIMWTPEGLAPETKPEPMTEEELIQGLEDLQPPESSDELPKIDSQEALREFNTRVIEGGADALTVFDEILKRIDTEEERWAFIKNIEENFLLNAARDEELEDSETSVLETSSDGDVTVPEVTGASAEELMQASEHPESDETPFEVPPAPLREPSLSERIAAFFPHGQREITFRGKKMFIDPDGTMQMRVGSEMQTFKDGDITEFSKWNSESSRFDKIPFKWNAGRASFEEMHLPRKAESRMDWQGRTPYDDVQ